MAIYNLNGDDISNAKNIIFNSNMHLDYAYDDSSNTNYTVLRVSKLRTDGTYQYPFVYCPNGTAASTKSTLDMNREKNFFVAINGGYGNPQTNTPLGVVIENGVAIRSWTEGEGGQYAVAKDFLTIDSNGDLGYSQEPNAQTLVSQGIISAVTGWTLLLSNYEETGTAFEETHAQRQIIGQFGNGDYAIVTCEGRDFDHSKGWSFTEAISILKKLGLKFAYAIDGGGSVETCIGKKQINTIYERTTGRIVSTYIVFNGTDHFVA